jgi:hypothetical protein
MHILPNKPASPDMHANILINLSNNKTQPTCFRESKTCIIQKKHASSCDKTVWLKIQIIDVAKQLEWWTSVKYLLYK